VALENAEVPGRNKKVLITVVERQPQYLAVRPGFSTGEGFRGAFEYGHRNIGGDAIGITMRAQASYLPDEFILDPQVRANFDTLSKGFSGSRLASRVTVSLTFPEIGLGPLVRMGIDGVYVRDLERDFVLQKFAGIPAINFRPFRALQFSLSQAFERNEVHIFGSDSVESYIQNQPNVNTDLARLLRLPNGASFAVAQKFVVTLDRRDNSFSAHSGFFISSGVEHVDWYALGSTGNAAEASRGHFVKFTETVAGYIPVTRRITLAAEVRFGNIVQLTDGVTYPDRQFFLGGVDSLRGWLQDTFVPQETANEIAAQAGRTVDTSKLQSEQCAQKLTIQCVALRGGNFMINPKLELRIPIKDPVETVIFGDAGNLWLDPNYPFNHGLNLRYSAGSGLRIQTPIGPLVFDYGINLSRLFASPNDPRKAYEDFGAFHFAIGLF